TGPVRFDFFGDTLETIRPFDPETQRSTGTLRRLDLVPMSEVVLDEAAVAHFRNAYRTAFGIATREDALYQSVSEGRRHAGMEHWLGFFHDGLATVFDFVPGAPVLIDHLVDAAVGERLDQIADHYDARLRALDEAVGVPYKPAPPDSLYLREEEWTARLSASRSVRMTPFAEPDIGGGRVVDFGARQGRSFAAERAVGSSNVFDAVVGHIEALGAAGKKAAIACWSAGTRDRMAQVLADHGLVRVQPVERATDLLALGAGTTGLAVLGLETGIETAGFALIAEQDILGDRLVRPQRRRKSDADVLTEATSLMEGDLVVHVDHGIGRFVGLKTITAAGAPHDCLELVYAGGDKLYLPVENIELLTRYGSEDAGVQLDKLGGVAWQSRKAKLKKRIRDMAEQLIKVAAARAMKQAPELTPPDGLTDEFNARFPFEETDDQLSAIEAVIDDLGKGQPMDRLICGDVGFGKTEVALRAAFVAVMSGKQVAVVVPTTLLSRQHNRTFAERFRGLPVNVAQASRMVSAKDLAAVKSGITDGSIDIVVGTHALLGKGIKFRDLGLLVIDEEQHFGVAHKERLKELKADVHVLTLSATPIPRTLQLALTGVRELSLIATPPVDRLAVRTFISPFDPLVIREALLRERYRGGQTFYVCPRISDLSETKEFLEGHVPEVKVAVAHGQMSPGALEDIMTAFYDGRYDVLLSTSIVESGLDIPTANTLVVHRADMFGLAQLYQLRGRVGRSKTRAYALFTVPADKKLTPAAERRLKVLQSLDTLGAGFQLASHDLDIRGAGNLLGEEQSGHIKEVGYELYQHMLEEAVASLKSGAEEIVEDQWSPQIAIGTPVLIPEGYVPSLEVRLSLYRRLADLSDAESIDAFGAEMIDRFGSLPDEVEHLLKIALVKALCRRAGVEKIEAGPKGVVIGFRNNVFAEPGLLVQYIATEGSLAKIRPDHRLVLQRNWPKPEDRLNGSAVLLTRLVRMVEGKGAKH
ncbi:MAG TPA: transcription-repair coupling factor, partial [Kaistiaceae bacterium]|nr:transcription-repair coupling factor [Kaistiaceae bacterium]